MPININPFSSNILKNKRICFNSTNAASIRVCVEW